MKPHVSPLSVSDQIDYLNDRIRCYVAPSKIHGIGVFALRNVKSGESLYLFPKDPERTWFTVPYSRFKELYPDIKELILARWPSVINGSAFLCPNDDVWMNSFVNHSDDFNYNQLTDSAIRSINKGEEITESYRIMDNYGKIYLWLK